MTASQDCKQVNQKVESQQGNFRFIDLILQSTNSLNCIFSLRDVVDWYVYEIDLWPRPKISYYQMLRQILIPSHTKTNGTKGRKETWMQKLNGNPFTHWTKQLKNIYFYILYWKLYWTFRTFVLLFVFHLKPNLRIDITVVDGIPLPIAKAFCLLKNCNWRFSALLVLLRRRGFCN